MTTTTTANKSAVKKTATPKPVAEPVQKVEPVQKKEIVVKEVDPNQYIPVRNGFQGQLVYKSPRTGEMFVWDKFGAVQDIELRELRNAKSSARKFFTNNWFMFDDDWVIDYLGVRNLYKNAIPIDKFDDIFTKSAPELKKILASVSDGQKRSIAYRARDLINQKKIDSLSVIAALEDALGIQLIEK